MLPAIATGFTMAFARAVGEYGSVIFIAGNLPMKTEITPLLIVIKLEQFDYARRRGARLRRCWCMSFVMLLSINLLQAWGRRRRQSPRDADGRRHFARNCSPRSRAGRAATRSSASSSRRVHHGLSLLFLAALLFAPLVTVFATALEKGFELYFDSFKDSDTLAAIRLTLTVAAIVVPLNTCSASPPPGRSRSSSSSGKSFLITLIDLPIAVSPVISGLVYVLLFGVQGWFGLWLQEHDISIIFALPGIVLATMFVTFPYVARELIPLMQQLGNDEEEAAITLGAGGLMTFFHVTLPKIRWGLVYGVILCNARAMGEFGAVSVVSGHIRGLTTTMPLHIEILYQRVQLRRRLRRGLAADAARRGHAGDQDARGMAHGI